MPGEVGKRLVYNFVNAMHDLYAVKYIHRVVKKTCTEERGRYWKVSPSFIDQN